MPFGDSAQSGSKMPGLIALHGCDEGYSMSNSEWEKLSQEYLFEAHGLDVDRNLFAIGAGYDCYYPNNYCHAEVRADGLFMRPSFATKLILKSSLATGGCFHDTNQHYGYHGTPAKNVKSILATGLNPSPTGAAGAGLYFSPYPLYAQLYSSSSYTGMPPTQWTSKAGKTYFVDTLCMIRYPKELVTQEIGSELAVKELSATVGSIYNLHKLFDTATWTSQHRNFDFENMVIGCLNPSLVHRVSVQGVIVKFHDKNQYEPGGEFDRIMKLLE